MESTRVNGLRCKLLQLLVPLISIVGPAAAIQPLPVDEGEVPHVRPVWNAAYQRSMRADPAWQAFVHRHGARWSVLWDARTGVPHRVLGPGVALGSLDESNVEERARAFITEHADLLRVDPSDLRLLAATRAAGKWWVVFQRQYEGIPVWGGRVDLRIMGDGRVTMFGGATHPGIDLDPTPAIGSGTAREIAAQSMGLGSRAAVADRAVLGVLPIEDGPGVGYALVWEVAVESTDPLGRWIHLVDAHTGAIVARWNEFRFGQIGGVVGGEILPETPWDEQEFRPFAFEALDVGGVGEVTSDEDGVWRTTIDGAEATVEGYLRGDYVRVYNADGPEGYLTATAPANRRTDLTWSDDQSLVEERNLYYHTVLAHDWVKKRDPGFTSLDYSMRATANVDGNCNAFWDGSGINFFRAGGSCPNIAHIADVVYHEYGHGLTQFHFSPVQPTGAMHEGFSDYLAATMQGQPLIGRGFFGPGSHLRNCDNDKVYPSPECGGESHCVGETICGALWHARAGLVAALGEEEGVNLADSLWHYAKYAKSDNELDYFLDYLLVDDDDGDLSNGTPHGDVLYPALDRHGFVLGLQAGVTYLYDARTPDIVADPGDEVSVVASYLLPAGAMRADHVIATIEVADEAITVVRGTSDYGAIEPGDEVDNREAPFILAISPALNGVRDVEAIVTLSAEPNFYARVDTISLRVGRSPVLLLDDDPADDWQSFYLEPLDSLGILPIVWTNREVRDVGFNRLLGFDAVVWYTGGATEETLTAEERAEIAAYLDSGGSLMLSSQNVGEEIASDPFYADYLKSTLVTPNTATPVANGIEGDPLSSGWLLLFAGEGGAPNWRSPDGIAPTGGGRAFLTYAESEWTAGVAYEGAYRLVYFPFNFEGISGAPGTEDRTTVLSAVLKSFDVEVGIRTATFVGEALPEGNRLAWRIVGYGASRQPVDVERATGEEGAFARITEEPLVSQSSFLDEDVAEDGIYRYRLVWRSGELEGRSEELVIRRGASSGLPRRPALAQNAPNPFNPSTVIAFEIPEASRVRVEIFDVKGRRIAILADRRFESGRHSIRWDGRDDAGRVVPSGAYLYRLETNEFQSVKRMILLK